MIHANPAACLEVWLLIGVVILALAVGVLVGVLIDHRLAGGRVNDAS